MAVEQLPLQVGEFARFLNTLMERLDQGGGWCGVFWQRDPDGMRACLGGWEVPPWDVVEALLQDVAAEYGDRAAAQEAERARALHSASLAAYDARPGGRDALSDRLDVVLREQRYAAERQAELNRLLRSAASQREVESIRLDLAWAHDDHERATARCAEIRRRMEGLDRSAQDFSTGGGSGNWADLDGAERPADVAAARQRDEDRPSEPGRGILGSGRAARRRARVPEQAGPRSPSATPAPRNDGPGSHPDAYGPAADATPDDPSGADPDAYVSQAQAHYQSQSQSQSQGGDAGGTGSGGREGAYGAGPDPRAQRDAAYAPYAGREAAYDTDRAERDAPYAPAVRPDDGPRSEDGARPDAARRDGTHTPAGEPGTSREPAAESDRAEPPAEDPAPPAGKQRSKRRGRGSARFAGMPEPEAETGSVGAQEARAPAGPAPAAKGRRTPRGARFAGAAAQAEPPRRVPLDDDTRRDTVETVGRLVRLRNEGRSGEAHAVLVEAAGWPAARFPLLAAELHRAGLDADWATLLWEAASLPADRLVAAADALVAAGRTADGQQMLRQGVSRPAPEIGAAVLRLTEEARHREIRALLGAYVRMRTPEESARSAEADPQRLVPLLLEAAKGVSEERHRDVVHALRVAGFSA
ncbi:hypothetical protein ACFVGN_19590 [Streptomyces sp. NPDC057757]|uniref:hypothetical protein n=1 Tax=Streptomyces sp. NPDC057757 TaxID=3346241 RepID=UPI003681754F